MNRAADIASVERGTGPARLGGFSGEDRHPDLPHGGTVMSKMDPVVHLEMPYDDRERMAKFYQDAFGWQTQMFGEEMGNYVLATTTETVDSRPKEPGAINGGFFPKRPDWPAQHPSVVIAVDDIQAAMKTVAEAGGKVLGEPLEIPGVGQYVSFYDTEGNRVSMLQPLPRN
jgi:predicted enzyme related to lactoylglutathione lyase